MEPAEQVPRVERVMSEALGGPVHARFREEADHYEGAPTEIVRFDLDTGNVRDPTTVILKRAREPQGILLHEWAALEFFAELDILPRLFGGFADEEWMLLEDLGDPAQRLGALLCDGEAARAEEALLETQRAIARLHVAGLGRAEEYAARIAQLGARGTTRHRVHQLPALLETFPAFLKELDVALTDAAARDLRAAGAALADPGPFLTWTHGDATPANAFCPEERPVRIFDLETGGYRHALVDGAFASIRYLHSVWARGIPVAVRRRAQTAYREALAAGCPAAADDALFRDALLAGAAAWMAGLAAFHEKVREADQRLGATTCRQRVVGGLDHFAWTSDEWGAMGALAECARAAATRLRERWPAADCDMADYPSFSA